ncbi:MAG: hypothetical protein ABI399_01540 [Bauldia sp.]
MIRKVLLLAVLAAFATPSLAAQTMQPSMQQGTPKERAACRSDVKKYCSYIKPGADSFAYLHCLQANRMKLKPACRGVLESHGQ